MTAKTIVTLALAALAVSANSKVAIEAQYECTAGTRLHAAFSSPSGSPGSVVLVFSGSSGKINLPQVVSADGGRYANSDMEFWIKGREATLTRDGKKETCHTN
ncbi:MliC family protein [Rhizobium sp. BK068]|uniref:MliC family protein n=1 Tax=Rhizobium sp. BK068 TaxID=2512130 RepID=UPI0010437F26|nr:MliC family protein [Rhizobium sp. BK068]TCM81607.1 membrane-bound inhibitor of C-type lysozyme [Rhizobium sp. BK068]